MVGGTLGLFAMLVGRIRGRPEIGLPVAAWSGLLLSSLMVAGRYLEGAEAKAFLDTKGIQIPKARLVERVGHIDWDDFALVGAGVGMLIAARRPGQMSKFSRYGGAACIGFCAADMACALAPWPANAEAKVELIRQLAIKKQYENEVWATSPFEGRRRRARQDTQAVPPHSAGPTGPTGPTSIQQLLRQGADSTNNTPQSPLASQFDEEQAVRELDETDPRPHLSELRDGVRVFRPETNYRWSPGKDGESELTEHIEELKKRRADLSREAELLFHQIAKREALFYDTIPNSVEKTERRASLEIMGDLHINVWIEIGMVDWMLQNSNKNLLQLKAMKEKTHWVPPPPRNAETIKPAYTLQLLKALEGLNRDHLDAISETSEILQKDPADHVGRTMTDPRTDMPTDNPKELLEYMAGIVAKATEEEQLKAKALAEISAEAKQQMDAASR